MSAVGLTILALLCAAIIALVALADTAPAAPKEVGADDYARLAHKAFAYSRWHDPSPVRRREARALRWMRHHAASPRVNRRMKEIHAYRKALFARNRSYRRVAPYPGLRGEGYWLRHLAVPAYIVHCETNGYHGEGRWRAANGSGAVGPYQLLGWGAPFPARTARQKLAHHRIAAHVVAVQGLSAWACA